jgi:membrane protein YdbS with pleckstrin-like domain
VWFQPRTSPPLDPRNLRPRRLWYAVAVLSLLLASPVSFIAGNLVGDWLSALAGLLLFLITPPTLIIVVLVRRAAHRRRITHEHLLREWEQAHRG